MQFKKRYILLLILCGIVYFVVRLGVVRYEPLHVDNRGISKRRTNFLELVQASNKRVYSYFDENYQSFVVDNHVSPHNRRHVSQSLPLTRKSRDNINIHQMQCTMETCFNYTNCINGFKVYVYKRQNPISPNYAKMLNIIEESRFYTHNPSEACIFVPSIDTLDQDVLSTEYVKVDHLKNLPFWNNGLNHIIFNQYTGTYPDYIDDFKFDVGLAIIAKASFSVEKFRQGFDISFPLFAKDYPMKGDDAENLHTSSNTILFSGQYLLAFKGKRYLTGVGSVTRNSLYHIHNGKDIVLLTTCKHGKGWQKRQDKRCEKDNFEYEKYDYKTLLVNSTFCLVPRGRRLGSFRFLEVLKAGCIPLVLSNDWKLPFSDVIDWNRALVLADERLLLQVPSIVRSFTQPEILAWRQQAIFLWDAYFSSVEKIVMSALELLHDRIYRHMARPVSVWNSYPGALSIMPEFSDTILDFPFSYREAVASPINLFTAVVYAKTPITNLRTPPLFRLLVTVAKSAFIHKIIVVWHCDLPPPPSRYWPNKLRVPVLVKARNIQSVNARFATYPEIETDAVFALVENVTLSSEEVDFAFSVWKEFPDRIVGYTSRTHHWDERRGVWHYSSKLSNSYSMILTNAAFYHRYYHHMYSFHINRMLTEYVAAVDNCEDILINLLVSRVTRRPPIKLSQGLPAQWADPADVGSAHGRRQRFAQRQACLGKFVEQFGYMPLLHSELRLDPVLFKDPVSVQRKKYSNVEHVGG